MRRHSMALAIGGAIIIALIQTVISVGLYVNSSTFGLDLSRPDFERAKQEIRRNTPQATFSSTGPIREDVIDDFLKLFDTQAKGLSEAGGYGPDPLSDEQLQLGAPPQEEPRP